MTQHNLIDAIYIYINLKQTVIGTPVYKGVCDMLQTLLNQLPSYIERHPEHRDEAERIAQKLTPPRVKSVSDLVGFYRSLPMAPMPDLPKVKPTAEPTVIIPKAVSPNDNAVRISDEARQVQDDQKPITGADLPNKEAQKQSLLDKINQLKDGRNG